jgi:hypothetical protein
VFKSDQEIAVDFKDETNTIIDRLLSMALLKINDTAT